MYKIVDPHNYLLMTLRGKIPRGLFEQESCMLDTIRTSQGNVLNLPQLKQVMNIRINI